MDLRPVRRLPLLLLGVAALLLSATGGAVAARLVTGADVKDGSLTGADLRNGTLTSADVQDSTLRTADLAPGTVAALAGVTALSLHSEFTPVSAGAHATLSAECPAGTTLASATAFWNLSSKPVQVVYDVDLTRARAYADGPPEDDVLRVEVICAKLG